MNPGDFYFSGLMLALTDTANLATSIENWHPPHGALMLHIGNGKAPIMVLTMERVRAIHIRADISEGLSLAASGVSGIFSYIKGESSERIYLTEAIFIEQQKSDLMSGSSRFI